MPSRSLVTGASGLVGSHVARALCERGDAVRVTVRPQSRMENVDSLDVESVVCDVLDRRAVRSAMEGIERVFHVAGTTSLHAPAEVITRINVDATRIVCEEALRAGVQRVVLTSSIAAVGPAPRGSTADETQDWSARRLGIPYVNAKREAETAALALVDRGLPLVVVNPAYVLGRGDVNRSSTEFVRRFLRREIPAYVDGALCVVDAGDVARGHLLADERGVIGERYILGNRNFTIDRLLADLGRMSGVEPPALKLPLPVAVQLVGALGRLPGRPPVTIDEVVLSAQWWAFRSTKAKRELGYKPSPHEDTLQATIDWYREREGDRVSAAGARQPFALRIAGFGLRRIESAVSRLIP